MAKQFATNVCEESNTLGTANYELVGNLIGYIKFRDGFNTADTPYYAVRSKDGSKYEYNKLAAFTEGTPDTLVRNVWLSSNANSPVSWNLDDLPLTIYVPADTELLELIPTHDTKITALLTDNIGTTRNAALPNMMPWVDSTAGFSARVPVKIKPASTEFETGAWEGASGLWLPSRNTLILANGAANLTVALTHANMLNSFDNLAAARTMTLPAGSSVWKGFTVGIYGLSSAFMVNVTPNGSDVIDFGAASQTLPLPGRVPVWITWDGTQWRTNFNYGEMQTLIRSTFSGVSSLAFQSLPYWVKDLHFDFMFNVGTSNNSPYLQTYGADGVLDTGGTDYGYLYFVASGGGTGQAQASSSGINLYPSQASSDYPLHGSYDMVDILAAVYTSIHGFTAGVEQSAIYFTTNHVQGHRSEADLITGLKITMSAGTMTGTFVLCGRG